ncbi:MFS transporter [Paenibacillus sp. JGP012]|uniref:MFS transporter n=1 Tax=Paenibacillus sp. JGP012 TaxID=2735914 RepID=UPI001618FC76|nr:MFS transporter [Paenibacillus sp. JGP012]
MRWLDNYPKEVKVFLLASLVNATGSALMWPLTTMYVFDELGRTMANAGFVILIQSLGGIVGQLLGGSLYHRVGVKKLIIGSLVFNAAGLFALPWISAYWVVFICAMGWIGLFSSLSMPAIQAFIGFRFAERRGELFNIIYVANNIGVAIGTALSGFLADFSYHLSFVLNGVTSAGFAVFFWFYLSRIEPEQGEVHLTKRLTTLPAGPGIWALLSNTRLYLFMSLGVLFLLFGNSIWNTGVSPYIIAEGMEKRMYGLLWTLNGVLIFVGQPFTSWVKRTMARTSTAQMTASAVFYGFAYVVMIAMYNYPGMVLAMVLATFGEMLISPATPAFISEHAGRAAPFYIGVSGGIGSIGRVIGPYMMGVMYDQQGLIAVTWLATGMAVIALLGFVLHAALNRNREIREYGMDSQGE